MIEFSPVEDSKPLEHRDLETPAVALPAGHYQAPNTDEAIDHVKRRAAEICTRYEGKVMNGVVAESLKEELARVPTVLSVGISAAEGAAEVVLRMVVNSVETWLKSQFGVQTPAAVDSIAPVVDSAPQNERLMSESDVRTSRRSKRSDNADGEGSPE